MTSSNYHRSINRLNNWDSTCYHSDSIKWRQRIGVFESNHEASTVRRPPYNESFAVEPNFTRHLWATDFRFNSILVWNTFNKPVARRVCDECVVTNHFQQTLEASTGYDGCQPCARWAKSPRFGLKKKSKVSRLIYTTSVIFLAATRRQLSSSATDRQKHQNNVICVREVGSNIRR